jgi:hypothetical protein
LGGGSGAQFGSVGFVGSALGGAAFGSFGHGCGSFEKWNLEMRRPAYRGCRFAGLVESSIGRGENELWKSGCGWKWFGMSGLGVEIYFFGL